MFANGLGGTLLPLICWTLNRDLDGPKDGWEETKVPPYCCVEYGLNPTLCCRVGMPWFSLDCRPKGGFPLTLPSKGLFPNICELDSV